MRTEAPGGLSQNYVGSGDYNRTADTVAEAYANGVPPGGRFTPSKPSHSDSVRQQQQEKQQRLLQQSKGQFI